MTINVLQLLKKYESNAPLINNMVKKDSAEVNTYACYLSGEPGGNDMDTIAKKVFYCRIRKKDNNWNKLSTLKKVAKIIDENSIDVVVCQFRRPIPIGVLAAALSKRKPKVVGVLHGIVGGKVGVVRKLINYFVYRRLAKLISVSNNGIADIMKHNVGLRADSIVAVQNGLDCQRFLLPRTEARVDIVKEIEADDFVFAMIGRLAPVKNHVRLIHAFNAVAASMPEAKLLIVGSGPLEAQLKSIVAELPTRSQIKFLGYREDIPALLKCIDVYLMPSAREGLPMALMEAMVSGVPVITSDRGGMKEVVGDTKCGYLIDPDSIDNMAAALSKMLAHSATEREAMGNNAKTRILENFTAEKMADAYETIYKQVTN